MSLTQRANRLILLMPSRGITVSPDPSPLMCARSRVQVKGRTDTDCRSRTLTSLPSLKLEIMKKLREGRNLITHSVPNYRSKSCAFVSRARFKVLYLSNNRWRKHYEQVFLDNYHDPQHSYIISRRATTLHSMGNGEVIGGDYGRYDKSIYKRAYSLPAQFEADERGVTR
jgi:hypothetical protein